MDNIESPVMQIWWNFESTQRKNINNVTQTPLSNESGYASAGVVDKNGSNSSQSTNDEHESDIQDAMSMMDYLLSSKLTTIKSQFHKRIDEFVYIYSPMLQEMCNRLLAECETKIETTDDMYITSKHVFANVMRQLYPSENGRSDRQNLGSLIALCGFAVVYTDALLKKHDKFDRVQVVTIFNQTLCEAIASDVHARQQLRKAFDAEHTNQSLHSKPTNSNTMYYYVPLSMFALAAVFLFLRRHRS